jgi:hypothetical protein
MYEANPWRSMIGKRLLPIMLALHGMPLSAQSAQISEYAVKSALLFKLPQFVYRPNADRKAGLDVCLLGSNPFGGALEKLAQAPVDGRPVKYTKLSAAAEVGECDFLFVSRGEAGNLEAVLRLLGKMPVVTVSDIDGFAKAGGMVELATGGDGVAVSIVINRKAAQRQNIEFNAQLLRLAKVIEP